MENYNIGPAPFGVPISFEPHPGATYGVVSPFGPQNSHIAQPGELGTQYVIPFGEVPSQPPTGLTAAQMAYLDQQRREQQGQQSLYRARAPQQTAYPAPGPQRTAQNRPQPRNPFTGHLRSCDCHRCGDACICPDCLKARSERRLKQEAARAEARKAEKREVAANHESFFWRGILSLLGSMAWCLPCWWVFTHWHPDAAAMSGAGTLQALVGVWFISTWIVGLIGAGMFIGGICSLAKPRVE